MGFPKLIFVPQPIIEDLKAVNVGVADIIDYDKVKKVLSLGALRTLVCLNAVSKNALTQIDFSFLQDLPAFVKFAPLLSEALDVRQSWLENSDASEVASLFLPSGESDYSVDTFTADIREVVKKVISGISLTDKEVSTYESITPSNNGQYFFVSVPFALTEDSNQEQVYLYHKDLVKSVLCKSAVFYSEECIVQSPVHSLYLESLV
uniref:Uncharacterized protein n=1 Tax=Myoviridae sp. ctLnO19 TaxID=2825085 RepID=A0A8S5P1L9_9CAUD|nr:MAG TPA: hypothetical protein [Myoviridae sp. ctLnO19]DAJ69089.1 MAG TPA: hypothetical protein [Caudoviricetes sp.]